MSYKVSGLHMNIAGVVNKFQIDLSTGREKRNVLNHLQHLRSPFRTYPQLYSYLRVWIKGDNAENLMSTQ